MNIRAWLNMNPIVGTSTAVAVLLVTFIVLMVQFRGYDGNRSTELYFWDVQADEHFLVPQGTVPPTEAPTGGLGVRAHLFTCGECAPSEWFGYLEKYTQEAVQRHTEQGAPLTENDQQVRLLDGDRWVPASSREGRAILESVDWGTDLCADPPRPLRLCLP